MSAIVTGMEMPGNCTSCDVSVAIGRGEIVRCGITKVSGTFDEMSHNRLSDCPLLSVDSVIEQMEVAKFVDPYGIDRDKRYNDGIRACIAILRGLEK